MEVRIPVSSEIRDRILRKEWDEHIAKIQSTPTKDVLGRYDQMGYIGKILKDIFLRENNARLKAFRNEDIRKFIFNFIRIARQRAKELGYKYEDMQVSDDSGITENLVIEIRFEPKPGAQRIIDGN